MKFKEAKEKAKDIVVKLRYLESIDNIIYMDRWHACPENGFEYETKVNSYLMELIHEKLLCDETKEVVSVLSEKLDDIQDDIERGTAKYLIDKCNEATLIPTKLQMELTVLNAESQKIWTKCHKENDFESYKIVLRKQFELQKKIAHGINPNEEAFQVLVNRFDKGYTLKEIDEVLSKIKTTICEIVEANKNKVVDDDFLFADDDMEVKKMIAEEVLDFVKFDLKKGKLYEIQHPVCTCIGPRDSRPATNYTDLIQSIQFTLHEAGHGFYNYNSDEEVVNAGLWGGIDGAMHESQSKFYELHIGKTKEFWEGFYPKLQEKVERFKNISVDDFYEAMIKIKPGLIRLKADELTSALHIIIRYEMERDYFEGKIDIDDFSDIWNEKYKEYMGLEPKTYKEGILQDVHWASGYIGYFQSYTLGEVYASQFRHALENKYPNAYTKLKQGDVGEINQWLKTYVHSSGQMYSAKETLEKATGEKLNVQYHIEYLKKKFM